MSTFKNKMILLDAEKAKSVYGNKKSAAEYASAMLVNRMDVELCINQ